MTKLTDTLISIYPELEKIISNKKETQAFLDEKTPEIINLLTENQIVEFTGDVYDCTAQQYNEDSHTKDAPPFFYTFLEELPQDTLVLDLGCGHGRDSQHIVESGRNVVPYDFSRNFVNMTRKKIGHKNPRLFTSFIGDFTKPNTKELISISPSMDASERLIGILRNENPAQIFDGIWACTSLLIHTPLTRLDNAVDYWCQTLKPDGLFAVSYFNSKRKGFKPGYNLRASTTGEIKIFISPTEEQVKNAFQKAEMQRTFHSMNDYIDPPKDIEQKAFFVNEIYKK